MLANAHIIIFIDYRLVLLKLRVAPVLNSPLLTNFQGYQFIRILAAMEISGFTRSPRQFLSLRTSRGNVNNWFVFGKSWGSPLDCDK